jgi:DNA-3-methyladenine glycosylase
MNKILEQSFFNRPTVDVAKDLIGKYLVRKVGAEVIALQINEVEAYDGPLDKASHASRGKTTRTLPMFGQAGYFYVYLCYGIHWMLNIVTGPKDFPAAILIRGAGDLDGPAKLTKYMQIGRGFNKKAASPQTGLWFEDRGIIIPKSQIKTSSRVGVDYAGPVWSKKPYRFRHHSSK